MTRPTARRARCMLAVVVALLLGAPRHAPAVDSQPPAGWDPVAAGNRVLARLVQVTADQVKGAHDAEFVCVGDRAYVVAEVNDLRGGENAAWPEIYCALSIVTLDPPALEAVIPFARSEQAFANATLPPGACFVPRIIRKDDDTLRCYFASEQPGRRQAQTWFRDFDLKTRSFSDTIHRARLVTAAGVVDMEPRHFHADAAAQGFRRPAQDFGLYLFDSFKTFGDRTYVALNNYPGRQNALAVVHDDLATFEIVGHFNEPQTANLCEAAVNRLPDGSWLAICRNDGGNYLFTTSPDGTTWTPGEPRPFVPNGLDSKPTFDRFGDTYYLGWQEATRIDGASRSVFNIDVSHDGKTWTRKYRFETPQSFQYPTFHEHEGAIWLTVTQGDTDPSRKERIMFGKLEETGAFEGPARVLHNGIELPAEWPPRSGDPRSSEPMDVPYLQSPPRVIPIDVGRQLFVDDFVIESTDLERVFHQAEKFAGNPVFKAETPRELGPSTEGEKGEEATTFTGQGGVFYDPTEKLFKLFYVAGWRGPLSLATSPDMKTWTRRGQLLPEGLRWTGPKLVTGGSDNCIWLDLNAKHPAARLKYLTCWEHVPKDQQPQGSHHSLHVSDGKVWSDAVTTTSVVGDYCSFFYDPFRQKWVFSIKMGTSRGRSRYYYESDDFLTGADWKKSVFWTCTDRLDLPEPADRYPGGGEPAELYSLNAVAYESLMVGMHYIHRGPRNEICHRGKFPKLIDLELGFSRDGFHWDRPDRTPFIASSRTEGSWDRAYLHGTAGVFVVLDDALVFPYMGTSGIAPSGHRGMYTGGSIGLAKLRRDGFASMDGPGTLTTRPVRFTGEHLFVNVDGNVRVELLAGDGSVLSASETFSGDSTKRRIDVPDLAAFAGKPVRFRFHLERGSLYAFWVTPDPKGASNGFVAAGGPEFPGTRDVAR
jgi:hypothetical protein